MSKLLCQSTGYNFYKINAFYEYALTNSTRTKSMQKKFGDDFYQDFTGNSRGFAIATFDDETTLDLSVFGIKTGRRNNIINKILDIAYNITALDGELHAKFDVADLDKIAFVVGFKKKHQISDERKAEISKRMSDIRKAA